MQIKLVYSIDPENRESKRYKATWWYITNQLKRNKDSCYEAPDVLAPVPPKPNPKVELT